MLRFITGNKRKFEEIQSALDMPLEQFAFEIPEIQSLDARETIREKLLAAASHAEGAYLVEDTSLYLTCLNDKLPGPLVKWFEKSIGIEGLVRLTESLGSARAEARVLIGYINGEKEMHFFEGACRGMIVPPRGDKDFGWGPIFVPEGHDKTFGEMDRDEKQAIGMRGIAARKLKEFLEK